MIFLDTADPVEATTWARAGVIRGFTTNPLLLGSHAPSEAWPALMTALLDAAGDLPVSLEVTSCDPEEMIAEGVRLAGLAPNVVVKIPIHDSSHPRQHFLAVIKALSDQGVAVNATAIMNAQQALVSALAGARYVSLFAGRVCDRGGDAVAELNRSRTLLNRAETTCDLIACSTRHPGNITEWLLAGADIVTVKPSLLAGAVFNPATGEVVDQFMAAVAGERP